MHTEPTKGNPPVILSDVTFSYPMEDETATAAAAAAATADGSNPPVLVDLSLTLPNGLTFMVGPNGIGKSTLMLLAAARLFPQTGEILLHGESTLNFIDAGMDPDVEERRNRLVSFVYQNMEFETEEPVGDVLELVALNSVDPTAATRRHGEIIAAADLADRLGARMQELSKGEMQRAIVAMSLLYGSPIVMMDEPVFAVEPTRAEKLFEYLRSICHGENLTIYTSVHDVQLAETFADAVVLMNADGLVEAGDPEELLERSRLESAFRAPWDTLYRRQSLYREFLRKY